MSARTATKAKAKVLRFSREPFVDSEYSTKHAEVQIRTGRLDDDVRCQVDLSVYDRENSDGHFAERVSILWELDRHRQREDGNGFELIEDHPTPHSDMLFRVDEIEAFATALYKAVQLAKSRGYLPSGKES
jgi:hypothetical protein